MRMDVLTGYDEMFRGQGMISNVNEETPRVIPWD